MNHGIVYKPKKKYKFEDKIVKHAAADKLQAAENMVSLAHESGAPGIIQRRML
jgi:hypothetical protein